MGCGNSKDKIEDELVKAKLERTEIQYERQRQIKLLKELDGTEYKPLVIPDYEIHSIIDKNNKKPPLIKSKTLKIKHKRNQSFAFKKKSLINRQNTNSEFKIKRKKSIKRKIIDL